MVVKLSYLNTSQLIDIKTPEEMWDVFTTVNQRVKGYLKEKGIEEFTYGRIYSRIDIRNRFIKPEDGVETYTISSTIESINVIFKETEESPTDSIRFRVGQQYTGDVLEVYGKAVAKAKELKQKLSLMG